MANLDLGINSLLRGLEAQQAGMDVVSHNIANASTPGYSRQSVDLQASDPLTYATVVSAGAGQMGTGVTVAAIQRSHDDLIQQQMAYQNQSQAQQQMLSDTLGQVIQVYNEPTNQGFSNTLSAFFTAWQQLSGNPADGPTRAVVAERGTALADSFNTAAASLQTIQQNLDTHVRQYVSQINGITQRIAGLNQQITSVVASGQQANDLADQRDTLLNQLSQLADIQYTITPEGAANVALVGAGSLVQGNSSFNLATIPDATQPQFVNVVFDGQKAPLSLQGGQLGGALTARDVTMADQLSALNSLAKDVVDAVNHFQSTGYGSNGATGISFFTGSTAATMAVDPRISADLANIAASAAPNSPGDGSQALLIAQLQENPAPGSTLTLQAQYQDIIGQLGVDAQQAQSNVQTGELVLQNLSAQQSSVSSVSLNEEASNLMQYQRAYEAAAHAITIMNQTIGDMIQQLGG
ncbi:MAG TPA: flagellar hook-associated protein FlgK [Chloroflexota bacterium]|nr:flagellar hook-associated protein FlgK [Chloroflexota bacterium]